MTQKSILLIDLPKQSHWKARDKKRPNVLHPGLLLIRNIFEENSINVDFINVQGLYKRGVIDDNKNIYRQLLDIIDKKNPEIIGFSGYGNNYINIIVLSKKIKNNFPEKKIVLGGIQPTLTDKKTLEEFKQIDYIIRGESEKAIPKFVEYLNGKEKIENVPNLSYRKNSEIKRNHIHVPSINEVPPIKYRKKDFEYNCINQDDYSFLLESGRGCPYNCSYCSSTTYWNKYRYKGLESIIEEIKKLKEKFNVNHIEFTSDQFAVDKKRIKKFCELIQPIDITWFTQIRVDSLDKELINKMDNSGCKQTFFGVESANNETLEKMNKDIKIEEADELIHYLENNTNMNSDVGLLIGFPFETIKSIEDTLRKTFEYIEIGSTVWLNILVPLKGSQLYKKHKEDLFFEEYFYGKLKDALVINREEEVNLIKEYKEFFSYYYKFRYENFNYYYLRGLYNVISNMINNYPMTSLKWYKKIEKPLTEKIPEIMGWRDNFNISKKSFKRTMKSKVIKKELEKYFKNHHDDEINEYMIKDKYGFKDSFSSKIGGLEKYDSL